MHRKARIPLREAFRRHFCWPEMELALGCALLWTSCGGGPSSPPPPAVGVTVSPVVEGPNSGQDIPPEFFGLNMSPKVLLPALEPWPTIPFGSIRLWDTSTKWADLNPQDQQYDFTQLDEWLAKAQSEGKSDLLYTFGGTPTWASSTPSDTNCKDFRQRPGLCDPPNDLNPDGSGTNQHWRDFVTVLATHTHSQFPEMVKAWEMWNEPTDEEQWKGTDAQLVRMAKDAYQIIKSIDPSALITTPVPGGTIADPPSNWMDAYLAAGGRPYADVISFHGYLARGTDDAPELLNQYFSGLSSVTAKYNVSSKPVWDTEASWQNNVDLPDADAQAAFLARFYLLHWPGAARLYWYQYDAPNVGTLFDVSTGQPTKAGVAYGQLYDWMVGAQMKGCSTSGTVWTCPLTRSGGYKALAVWDASQSCSDGTCSTSSYTPDASYTQYRDLEGSTPTPFTPGTPLLIGAKAILLESMNSPGP